MELDNIQDNKRLLKTKVINNNLYKVKNILTKYNMTDELFSNDSDFKIELSENEKKENKKAIISMPLITAGQNKKFVQWEPNVLEKITNLFKGVVFKYDVNGSQGSSHVPEHLYSPFYDVGWTYEDDKGAWFDGKSLWISGEVTNPEVISKLSREGANGKRELNAGSSGVILNYDDVHCSICGTKPFGSCQHRRGQVYDGLTCCIVPEVAAVEKALHVALTNDPADGEAIIHDLILQEQRIGDIGMNNIKIDEVPKPVEKKPEEKKPEEKKAVETAEAGKKMISCPSCGHKFSTESADGKIEGLSMSAPKESENEVPKENITPNRVSGEEDVSTKKNRESLQKQGSLESQDNSGLINELKSRIVSSINSECKRLGRNVLEVADMSVSELKFAERLLKSTPSAKENIQFDSQDLSGYGMPIAKENKVELADMNAEERSKKFGGSFYAFKKICESGKLL